MKALTILWLVATVLILQTPVHAESETTEPQADTAEETITLLYKNGEKAQDVDQAEPENTDDEDEFENEEDEDEGC